MYQDIPIQHDRGLWMLVHLTSPLYLAYGKPSKTSVTEAIEAIRDWTTVIDFGSKDR
jgi:hypothetical protein